VAEKQSGNLTAADFYHALYRRFDAAAADGETVLEVSAGELHKTLKAANRLSLCCNCLYDMQNIGDVILNVPSGGVGSTSAACSDWGVDWFSDCICIHFCMLIFLYFFMLFFREIRYIDRKVYTRQYFLMNEKYCGDIDHYTKWDEKRLLIV